MSKLFLLPNSLDSSHFNLNYFPSNLNEVVLKLDGIFVETEKLARKYLLNFMEREKMQKIQMWSLNEHTKKDELEEFIEQIKEKKGNFGILSDAGMPCIADPGAKLIEKARKSAIEIISIPGPSSIIMALMLSGCSAQKFVFHGYLPRKEDLLLTKLKKMEKNASEEQFTHLWIEAPYRNDKMLKKCLEILNPNTRLCVAVNLTSKDEKVISSSINTWRRKKIEIGKNPCVFLMSAK